MHLHQIIEDHPDGFIVDLYGEDATTKFHQGYLTPYHSQLSFALEGKNDSFVLQVFMAVLSSETIHNPHLFISGYLDEEEATYHLTILKPVLDIHDAIRLTEKAKQEMFYDLKNKTFLSL